MESPSERYIQQNNDDEQRIYEVTEGHKSKFTADTYRIAFQTFLDKTVKNPDLRALLDTKSNVLEFKIITHIEYLKNVKKIRPSTIQTYVSAIYHFFSINDVILNTRKINRFLPSDDYDSVRDRPYSEVVVIVPSSVPIIVTVQKRTKASVRIPIGLLAKNRHTVSILRMLYT